MSEVNEIDEKTGFPKLYGGCCNGAGWLNGDCVCWCGEFLALNEEFQRVENKPWKNPWEDEDCKKWDHIWRFGTERWKEAEKQLRETRKISYRETMDRIREENRQLRIKVFQLTKKLKE